MELKSNNNKNHINQLTVAAAAVAGSCQLADAFMKLDKNRITNFEIEQKRKFGKRKKVIYL